MTRAFVTFLLVLGICQASFLLGNAADEQVDSPYRLPEGVVKPTDYKLHLTPDLEKFTFEGEVEITLSALVNTDKVTLNSKELQIKVVQYRDVKDSKFVDAHFSTDEAHETLSIQLKPPFVKDGNYLLKITYSGTLNDNKRGFYRSRIMDNGKPTGYVAATHFEPTGARLAFPCWDEPNYKAKFTISLTHNKSLMAISNMDEYKKSNEKNDMITTSFNETQPMSTYLVAFVVGDYVNNIKKGDNGFFHRVWTKRTAINQTEYALEQGEALLKELDKYMDINYQKYMPKMDQVSLKDFSAGAMENWGLVTYRETALLYDKEKTTTRSKMSILTVIAHEFTHQWFGNLVSPKWWKYIWLNEGFANYFQYFITHKVKPELRLDEMFVVEAMQGNAMIADAELLVRPMNKDVVTPKEISDLFDSIAYQKAGSVIRMMSHAMTEEVFQSGLQNYLKEHALKNADSNDLFGSLQKELSKANITFKASLADTMKEWVEQPGYPLVKVTKVKEGYKLEQERFLIVMQKTVDLQASTKWWIPITFVEESNPDFSQTTPVDWFDPSKESYIVKSKNAGESGWYLFNKKQTGYYRVNYDEENWKLLTKELHNINKNSTKIHVLNRAQLLDDAMNVARINRLNYTVALDLTLYLKYELDYMPWQPAFRHLSFLQNLLRTSEKYYTFKRYVAHLMSSFTKEVSYEPKENDSELVKMLKVTAMKWACEVGVENCTAYAEQEYQRWLKNPETKLDVDLKSEILCAGVRSANETEWDETKERLIKSTNDVDERKTLIVPLACSNSTAILEKYLNSTLSKDAAIDFQTAVGHIVSRYPAGPELVYQFLIKEYGSIQKLENFQSVMKAVAEAIGGGITTNQQYINLNAFLGDRKLASESAMAKATKNLVWINEHGSTVEGWLADNSKLFESIEKTNSASSMAIASFLVIFSLFITRFY